MEKDIKNYRIKIIQEECPESPRNWDNLGTMVCFHRRYILGDKHDYDHNDYSGWDEMERAIIKNEDAAIILPLYLYDHGGVTISTSPFSCPWDSGQIGFIYVSKKKLREEYGVKRLNDKIIERATNVLKGEVETYDQYLTGDIYGYEVYRVTTCNEGHEHENLLDSCWGYYGKDDCLSEAEGIVAWNIKNDEKEVVV